MVKHSQTILRIVFDHFEELAFRGLKVEHLDGYKSNSWSLS